jgi:threonine dehydrogenase-like Zn-dependent dehydrogenase
VGPLRLVDTDVPDLPGPGWHRVRPRLSGICGSDLATIDATSPTWFEPIVSFPFVPGHEIVGELDDGTRVVVEPVLACATRGIDPPCPACARGATGNCERIAFGHLKPGLQTGYCADTGGGWSTALVAHESQLHRVPDQLSDEAAVMIEPTACAVHAALSAGIGDGDIVTVIGAGTLGLCTIAAVRRYTSPATVITGARYPEQRALATDLGADVVVEPDALRRAVRRAAGTMAVSSHGGDAGGGGDLERLTGGADVVIDCVGSAQSIAEALAVTRPRGRVVMVGMPGQVGIDLTPLWQREIALVGAYAYGREADDDVARGRRSFELATDLVETAHLERLVSATYPLNRFAEAIEHAAEAGRRGAVKIAFDLRNEKERDRL